MAEIEDDGWGHDAETCSECQFIARMDRMILAVPGSAQVVWKVCKDHPTASDEETMQRVRAAMVGRWAVVAPDVAGYVDDQTFATRDEARAFLRAEVGADCAEVVRIGGDWTAAAKLDVLRLRVNDAQRTARLAREMRDSVGGEWLAPTWAHDACNAAQRALSKAIDELDAAEPTDGAGIVRNGGAS
jgi:hypothetical protein